MYKNEAIFNNNSNRQQFIKLLNLTNFAFSNHEAGWPTELKSVIHWQSSQDLYQDIITFHQQYPQLKFNFNNINPNEIINDLNQDLTDTLNEYQIALIDQKQAKIDILNYIIQDIATDFEKDLPFQINPQNYHHTNIQQITDACYAFEETFTEVYEDTRSQNELEYL